MVNIIESLDYNIRMLKDLDKKKELIKLSTADILNSINRLDENILDLKDCKASYNKAVELLYEEGVGDLKNTINAALQLIIFDKNYNVELVLEDKRGTKTLSILLIDLDTGLEIDIHSGVGNGIRTIISFVLKMYYLINKGSSVLVLDEAYSALSEEYVFNFFEFVKKMCVTKKFIIIIITHDNRFTPFADKVFKVADGVFSIIDGL